jgi:hypothetical protein
MRIRTVKRAKVRQGSTQERTGIKARKASSEPPSGYERIRLPRLSVMAKWGGLFIIGRNILNQYTFA